MGRHRIENITERQREALRAVQKFIEREGYPPTMKELAPILGISPPAAHGRVNQLVRKGFLKRNGQKARSLAMAKQLSVHEEIQNLVAVPVLGTVRAGRPIFAEENFVGEVLIEERVTRNKRCFALKVRGDSMRGAEINEGDLIIVAQQETAENGDIVVVLIEDEATVKRFYKKPTIVELHPENPAYRSILVGPDDIARVLGKVIAIRRQNSL